MKVSFLLHALALGTALALGACKKDNESPSNNATNVVPKEYLTTYSGDYTTTTDGNVRQNVTATVADNGSNTIKITFSVSGSPVVTVPMQKKPDGTYANSDNSGTTAVSISSTTLDVSVAGASGIVYSGTR